MKKVLLFLMVFVSIGLFSFSQQRPYYTQYILNNYILNPAISGIENYIDLKMSMRNQWVGIEGAPSTFYISAHGPIGKVDMKQTPTSLEMKGENPRGKRYWEEYTTSPPHHGVGVNLINYNTGYTNKVFANASYAYHVGINENTSLSAGFGLGLSSNFINFDKITLQDYRDPAIRSINNYYKINPELSSGLFLYSADYFVGLSAQGILPTNYIATDTAIYGARNVPHIFLTGGYKFFLNEDITVLPSVMMLYMANAPLYKDVNVKLQYQDRLWVGMNYRVDIGLAAMAGINISQRFNISYSYDTNTPKYMLQSMQRGTHEIVMGFLLNNVYGDMCPRNVW
jgi:type IX secretion system PorP/SprF family membrane protein